MQLAVRWNSDTQFGCEIRTRNVLGLASLNRSHHHLRTETVDDGQQSQRRDIRVCHVKLTGADARANNVGYVP
jgi:hypothetical protein